MDKSSAISVLIPTCNRLTYLCEAIESVRRQTARNSIAEVIVSENSLNDESREVCDRFPDLPIVYLQQKPPVSPMQHGKIIFAAAKSPIIALLHDDDWWAPDHLEAALRVLIENPDCAAVFSNMYEISNPTYPGQIPLRQWFVWLSSGCDYRPSALIIDQISVLMCCLLHTTFHYSTVVGRVRAIREAFDEVYAAENSYDNDRTFPVFLSSHGTIGFLTAPDTYIRLHPSQDSAQDYYRSNDWKLVNTTTKWLLSKYPQQVAQASERFNKAVATLLASHEPWLLNHFTSFIRDPHRSTLRRDCGFNLPQRKYNSLLRELFPPALFTLRRRILILGNNS